MSGTASFGSAKPIVTSKIIYQPPEAAFDSKIPISQDGDDVKVGGFTLEKGENVTLLAKPTTNSVEISASDGDPVVITVVDGTILTRDDISSNKVYLCEDVTLTLPDPTLSEPMVGSILKIIKKSGIQNNISIVAQTGTEIDGGNSWSGTTISLTGAFTSAYIELMYMGYDLSRSKYIWNVIGEYSQTSTPWIVS